MQRFNSINLESKFIKNILQNTYIPTLPTIRDGDFIVSGVEYSYRDKIIKCNSTGIFTYDGKIADGIHYIKGVPTCSDYAICGSNFICGQGNRRATYSVTADIDYKTFHPGFNYKFKSHTDKYDSLTHRSLGDYLRWYRDYHNINLMAFYNCFCGETSSLIYIKDNQLMEGYDPNKVVSIVPIQLNKKYTIFISSSHKVSICGTFLNSNGRILNYTKETKYMDELLDNGIINLTLSTYSQPISFTMKAESAKLLSYNKHFYLVVQTEANTFSPIVVMEGDYSRYPLSNYYGSEGNPDYDDFEPIIRPSIILSPTNFYLPYSERLIEFLTENAITSLEDIPKNVYRVKDKLRLLDSTGDVSDVWSNKLRYKAYINYFKYDNPYYFKSSELDAYHNPNPDSDKFENLPDEYKVLNNDNELIGLKNCKLKRSFDTDLDITGYIDKDIENSLFRYRSV